MANPRQRRKARSGSHKAVRHSNNAKKHLKKQPPIRGAKVLQDAWDPHKTVRQNYDALGLLPTLTPDASGGIEQHAGPSERPMTPALAPEASGTRKEAGNVVRKGYGRIVRDANGNIIDVDMGEEDRDEQEEAAGTAFPEDVDVSREAGTARWVSLGSERASEGHVVESLEAISRSDGRVLRHSSDGESKLLRNLVARYGEDVDGMARDRKLNRHQWTAGEVGRAIAKAGGVAALCEGSCG